MAFRFGLGPYEKNIWGKFPIIDGLLELNARCLVRDNNKGSLAFTFPRSMFFPQVFKTF